MFKLASKKKNAAKVPKYTLFPAVVIMALIAVMPLAAVTIDITLSDCELWLVPNVNGIFTDHCMRFHEILVFLAGCILLLYWAGERIFPDDPPRSPLLHEKAARLPLIFSGAYLLFSVVSALFSEHGEISFWGIASESEGVAAVFGYVMLFLAGYCFLRGDALRLFSAGALTASAVMTVMFIIELISGQQMSQLVWGVRDIRTGTALLFGSPVACSEYAVLLFPVLLMSGAASQKPVMKAVYSTAAGFMLCIAVSSYSSAAFAGLLIAVVLCAAALVFLVSGGRKKAYSALAFVPFIIMTATDLSGTLGKLYISASNSGAYSPGECFRLTDIGISEDELTLISGEKELTIVLTETGAQAYGNGVSLGVLKEEMTALPGDYSAVSARLTGGLLQLDLGYDDTIEFQAADGAITYIGLNGYLVPEPEKSAFPELSEYYGFATGRGYIWLNSVPALKDCLILGTGAGQFAYRFPQSDIVGMLNTHGTTALLTDKPHSLYLGIAISDGISALAAFLCISVLSVKRAIPSLRDPVRTGAAISVLCFLIMGIANDSSAVYSSLFWVLAGISVQRGEA